MTLQNFIEENTTRDFKYYELEKTNPFQYDELDKLELLYLNNCFKIYRSRYMNYNSEIITNIFNDYSLHLKVTHMCDTNEKLLEFFNENGIKTKEIWYNFDIKSSMKKFDDIGRNILTINYSNFSGYKIKYPKSDFINKISNTEITDIIKTPLSFKEIEEYL